MNVIIAELAIKQALYPVGLKCHFYSNLGISCNLSQALC